MSDDSRLGARVVLVKSNPRYKPPPPGGVEVQRPPLGGKNEGSIPVVLGFFFVVFDSHRGKRESVSKQRSQLSLFVVS